MSGLDLRGATAIVGVAESDLGSVGPDRFAVDLAAQAAVAALDDAGLTTRDVDALYSIVPSFGPNLNLGEYLGIRPRVTGGANIGGSAFVSHLYHASMALAAGQCDVALIAYGSTPRADRQRPARAAGIPETPNYQEAYKPRDPVSGYALVAARHMHEFGTTREQLADVAIAAREWAKLNPVAYSHGEPSLTRGDVLGSRMVSTPLTVRDCCLVTDGGGALVVTRADRAKNTRKAPAYFLGAGEAHYHRHISSMPDLTASAAVDSSARAYKMAGLGPADIDVVQLYDAFTINTIMFLEDLGFCAKGEGGAFVEGGRIAPGGSLPVNTNGGGLSYCHPGMYGIFTLIEAVRQLRGETGARQVKGAEIALAHGNGGQFSSQVTAILGTGAAL